MERHSDVIALAVRHCKSEWNGIRNFKDGWARIHDVALNLYMSPVQTCVPLLRSLRQLLLAI